MNSYWYTYIDIDTNSYRYTVIDIDMDSYRYRINKYLVIAPSYRPIDLPTAVHCPRWQQQRAPPVNHDRWHCSVAQCRSAARLPVSARGRRGRGTQWSRQGTRSWTALRSTWSTARERERVWEWMQGKRAIELNLKLGLTSGRHLPTLAGSATVPRHRSSRRSSQQSRCLRCT